MSTTIDNRVLEMRFDNKQFEQGVSTTMSTLDKLKQKLNLTGASKGLEDISRASKNVDMSGLGRGVETVQAKFSALQVVGVTALANITNQAVNAGKRMVSALTIDPIKSGFQEYETQLNSVQTILSNTMSEGTDVKKVNAALDELNTYADKTIYNFTEMTRNIGTFTAAGVKLDDSVAAIKGIANLAAISGSSSQQASTAMYQLSQALAAGKVSLMDWNSVVNAGMGGKIFQDALIRTSELMGTGAQEAIKMHGTFRESLTSTGWLTTDVLKETLKQISGAYTEAELISQGYTESQAEDIIKLADQAMSAAQDVKTFTQMFDVLKEAAQSGWAQTWRLIFGDFEEAKTFWTSVSNTLTDLIGKFSDFRNKILENALSKNLFSLKDPFEKIYNTFDKIINPAKKVNNTIGEVAKTFNDLDEIASKVIKGDFGNGQERFDKLTESGQNWMKVQNKVNETLGDSHRYTEEQIEAQEKLIQKQSKATESTKDNSKANEKNAASKFTLSEENKKMIKDMASLGDELEKSDKYTKDQVEAFRELEQVASSLGVPIVDLIDNIENLTGRFFLLNGIKNIGRAIAGTFKAIGDGWVMAFGKFDRESAVEGIFNAVLSFSKLTASLIPTKEEAENLSRTFAGLFAIIDILTTIVGGGFKIAFKLLSKILGAFDMNILDLTANMGDAIVAFRDFLFNNDLVNKGFELLATAIVNAAKGIKDFCNAFKDLPMVQTFVSNVKSVFEDIRNIDLTEVGRNIIEGLQNGLSEGVSNVFSKMIEIGQGIIDAIKGILGIHSPSRVMMAIGGFIIAGLVLGLKMAFPEVWDAIVQLGKDFVQKCQDTFSEISWDKILASGLAIAMVYFIKQISDAVGGIAHAFDSIGSMFDGVADVLKGFDKVLKGFSWNLKAKAMQKMAISIAILAASVAVLSYIEPKKLWNAVGIIAALSAILVALGIAMDKMTQASVKIDKGGASIDGMKSGLIQIGIALLLLAATVKIVGSMNPEAAKQGFLGMTGMILAIITLFTAFGAVAKYGDTTNIDKLGGMILKISLAMILLVGVCKLVGKLSTDEMIKGAAFAGAFIVFVTLLSVASKFAGDQADEIGKMVFKLSLSMILLVGFCKLAGGLSKDEMIKGAAFAGAFLVFVGALVLISKMFPLAQIQKISGMVFAITVSLMLMVGVCKLVGLLSPGEMIKGGIFATVFLGLIAILVKVCTIGSEQQMAKVAASILAFSVAVGILAAVCMVMSLLSIGALAKGLTAVVLLGGIMTAMIWATRGANDVKGNIIAMTVAIGVLAAAVVILSMINPTKLAGATAAMTILMGMFALIAKSSSNITSSMATLIVMTVAIGLIGGIVYLLAKLPIESVLGAAVGLSALLLAISASMTVISKMGVLSGQALVSIGAMTIVVGALALIVGLLSKFGNVNSYIPIAVSLSTLLLALSACTAILAVVGLGGPAALIGIGSLLALIVSMGGLMVAIGALVTYVPQMETFINKALPILNKIGQGIGEFLGGIVAGFASAALSILPKFGMALSAFMVGVTPFIRIASTVDSSVLTGVGYLSGAILALTAANLISGIGQFLSFGQSFVDLGSQLSAFIMGAAPFLAMIRTIDPASVEAANTLAKMIMTLTKADLLQGITSFLTGGPDFSDFGSQLTAFGKAVVEFSNTISGGKIDPEAVNAAAEAGLAMAKVAKAIPKKDGFLQDIVGEADLEEFGVACEAFGYAIKRMSTALTGAGGETLINPETIDSVVKAGQGMTKIASAIPKKDGFLQDIVGEQDLEEFGLACEAFGYAIKRMSTALSGSNGENTINNEAIEAAVKAGQGMTKLNGAIPKKEGWLQDIVGEQDLESFGAACEAFGSAIKTMSDSLGGTDGISINLEAIDAAISAGKKMTALANALPSEGLFDGKMNLTEFSDYIGDFGDAISDFGTKVANVNVDSIGTAISAANRIKNLIQSLVGLDTSGVAAFTGIGTGGFGADGAVSDIAKAIADFCNKTAGIDTGVLGTSVSAALKLKSLISGLAGLDTSGIENFKIDKVGTAISGYFNKVSGIDPGVLSGSISAAQKLKNFISSLSGFDASGVSSFKTAIDQLSTVSIQKFVNSFKASSGQLSSVGANMINSLANGLKQGSSKIPSIAASVMNTTVAIFRSKSSALAPAGVAMMNGLAIGLQSGKGECISVVSGISTAISSSIKSKSSAFRSSGLAMMSGLSQGLTSGKAKCISTTNAILTELANIIKSKQPLFTKAGEQMTSAIATGIKSKSSTVKSAASSVVSSAASACGNKYSAFYNAGANISKGLAAGIRSGVSAARTAARELAAAADEAARARLKINSPSKVFRAIGAGIPEGMAQGVTRFGGMVKRAVTSMSTSAIGTTAKSIARISDLVNSDIDAQPTIRPVVDLSDVKSGARSINGMLNIGSRIGVSANIDRVSSLMSKQNQNGGNDDVVSAINKLGKRLGNTNSTTYNVNGVNVNNNSDVSSAIETLIRYAVIEGRA